MRLCSYCSYILKIPLHAHTNVWGKCDHCEDMFNTYEINGPHESVVELSKADNRRFQDLRNKWSPKSVVEKSKSDHKEEVTS